MLYFSKIKDNLQPLENIPEFPNFKEEPLELEEILEGEEKVGKEIDPELVSKKIETVSKEILGKNSEEEFNSESKKESESKQIIIPKNQADEEKDEEGDEEGDEGDDEDDDIKIEGENKLPNLDDELSLEENEIEDIEKPDKNILQKKSKFIEKVEIRNEKTETKPFELEKSTPKNIEAEHPIFEQNKQKPDSTQIVPELVPEKIQNIENEDNENKIKTKLDNLDNPKDIQLIDAITEDIIFPDIIESSQNNSQIKEEAKTPKIEEKELETNLPTENDPSGVLEIPEVPEKKDKLKTNLKSDVSPLTKISTEGDKSINKEQEEIQLNENKTDHKFEI